MSDPVAAMKAGLDLEMPPSVDHAEVVLNALGAGELSEAELDLAYERLVRVLKRAADTQADADADGFNLDLHHQLAREAAHRSVVLLENDGVLPLDASARVAVVGEFARTPRYQGAGSSRVNPTRLDNALEAIRTYARGPVAFAPGFTTDPRTPAPEGAHDEAVRIAAAADLTVLFLGLGEDHESEGYDRTTLDLPAEQLALLDDVLRVNPNVVVVLSNGSSVLVPFAGRVRAVVEGWLLGQAGGSALADVLYGHVNPSGKLTETIPLRLEDVPSHPHFPGDVSGVRYGEGLFVGYRGYDARALDVAYPFGHGLSYTTFDNSGLQIRTVGDLLEATLTVTNTGETAGREIVQLYVGVPTSVVERAPRELKQFADVCLAPGESQTVELVVPVADLAYWSVTEGDWVVESATYEVSLGASSRDLRLSAEVHIPGGGEATLAVTLDTTFGEALAVPGFAEAAAQLMGASSAEDGGEGPDPRMLADIPLGALAVFSRKKRSDVLHLVQELDRARAATTRQVQS